MRFQRKQKLCLSSKYVKFQNLGSIKTLFYAKKSSFYKFYQALKKMCVSDRPTDPNIFYAKKKNRSTKSGNSSLFPCLFQTSTIFFISQEHTCRFQKKNKSQPTDPNFEDHAIGNTHIFFLALHKTIHSYLFNFTHFKSQ